MKRTDFKNAEKKNDEELQLVFRVQKKAKKTSTKSFINTYTQATLIMMILYSSLFFFVAFE